MKNIIYTLIFTFAVFNTKSQALEFKLFHPCESKLNITSEILLNESESALNITIANLKNHKINHQLLEGGIKSIYTLNSEKNLEIIDAKNFISYGWCYSVNGQLPESMPDQYHLVNNDSISWFLGSSEYSEGQWISYCRPVHLEENSKYCKE